MKGEGVILYIHGMGGGSDSRIPGILMEYFPSLVVRTYDFQPEIAEIQIRSWIEELSPVMLVGESMGALHALAMHHAFPALPIILVSPALNAPEVFYVLSFLSYIPGMRKLLERVYRPRPGDRQVLHFDHRTLKSWRPMRKMALDAAGTLDVHAFIGTRDHYRRSGIVSLRTWRRYFGDDSFTLYEGTHFMEEEYVRSILVQKISSRLGK